MSTFQLSRLSGDAPARTGEWFHCGAGICDVSLSACLGSYGHIGLALLLDNGACMVTFN